METTKETKNSLKRNKKQCFSKFLKEVMEDEKQVRRKIDETS